MDRLEAMRVFTRVVERRSFTLAAQEHEYTRWGFKRFVEKDALDILRPDPYCCGGLSETMKIAACATEHDLVIIPHGHSTRLSIHVSAAQSPIHTPYREYLTKRNDVNQRFVKNPLKSAKGLLQIPTAPGINMEPDTAKIEKEEEVRV